MVPIPPHRVGKGRTSIWTLPAEATAASVARAQGDHRGTVRPRPLPTAPYEACEKTSTLVTSLSLVRYRSNDYSVPTEYGHRQVLVKG
jgi:hypothetical protein